MTDRSLAPTPPLPGLNDALRCGIQNIYAQAQKRTAALGGICEASGRCCSFREFGHELWLTNLELAYLVETHGVSQPGENGICPYLDAERKCGARDGRALGCRVFFCNLQSDVLQDVQNEGIAQLRELAAQNGIELFYDEFLASLAKLA